MSEFMRRLPVAMTTNNAENYGKMRALSFTTNTQGSRFPEALQTSENGSALATQ